MARMYWNKHGIENICVQAGSLPEAPAEFDHLGTWHGHKAVMQLLRCIQVPTIGCLVVWCASNSTRSDRGNGDAEWLGYRPEQTTEDDAAKILHLPDALHPVAQRLRHSSILLVLLPTLLFSAAFLEPGRSRGGRLARLVILGMPVLRRWAAP